MVSVESMEESMSCNIYHGGAMVLAWRIEPEVTGSSPPGVKLFCRLLYDVKRVFAPKGARDSRISSFLRTFCNAVHIGDKDSKNCYAGVILHGEHDKSGFNLRSSSVLEISRFG